MRLLTRYWFEFEITEDDLQQFGYFPAYGIGVTAYNYEDALRLLRRWITRGKDEFPRLKVFIQDVDVSELFPWGSRLPQRLGCPVWRGVWYPAYNLYFGPELEP